MIGWWAGVGRNIYLSSDMQASLRKHCSKPIRQIKLEVAIKEKVNKDNLYQTGRVTSIIIKGHPIDFTCCRMSWALQLPQVPFAPKRPEPDSAVRQDPSLHIRKAFDSISHRRLLQK